MYGRVNWMGRGEGGTLPVQLVVRRLTVGVFVMHIIMGGSTIMGY